MPAPSRRGPAAVGALFLLLAGARFTAAGRTETAPQRTYWDRLMEVQAARNVMAGSILLAEKRYDDAVKELANAAVQTPDDPKVHQLLGAAYYWSGRVDQAEVEFRESLRLDAQDAQTHVLLGIVYAWNGKTLPAYEAFQTAAALDGNRADIQMNLGSVEETQGRFPEALAHFRRAVDLDPEHPLYHYQLGMLYRLLGRDEDAMASLERSLKHYARYQDAMLELGSVYERNGRSTQAFDMFERAVKIKERDAVARYRLARAALKLGKSDKARQALAGVFRLTPADRSRGLALSVSYGGKPDGGGRGGPSAPGGQAPGPAPAPAAPAPLEVLAKNLARIPFDQDAALEVDMAFLSKPKIVQRKVDETPSSLKRALEDAGKPQNPLKSTRREFSLPAGSGEARRQDIQRVLDDLQRVLDAAPPDAETRLAMNLKFSDRPSGAPAGAGKGGDPKVSYQPRDVGNDMGLWVVGTGWTTLVEEALEEDEETLPKNGALWWVVEGIGRSTLGDSERASAAFERALALDPRSELAYLGRGVAMVIRGDEAGAVEAYRKALAINPKNQSAAEGLKWLLQEPAKESTP